MLYCLYLLDVKQMIFIVKKIIKQSEETSSLSLRQKTLGRKELDSEEVEALGLVMNCK